MTGKKIDIFSGKEKGKGGIKIGFIKSTKGSDHHALDSNAPAAARVQRANELVDSGFTVKDVDDGILVPCLAHGDYVKVECTQLDHMQPKANILKRQKDLIEKLNEDETFASFLMKKPGMKKFFIKCNGQYYGTLLFYEVYFNDIDNLWLICSACNLSKSDQETLHWLENQWLYGKEFLDYLAKKGKSKDMESPGILEKTRDKQGLAEVAITWFWERHANYVSTSKKLYEDVITPIQILNKQVDHIIGSGNLARAARRQVDLDARVELGGTIKDMRIGVPKHSTEEEASDSDPDLRVILSPDSDGLEPQLSEEAASASAKKSVSMAKKLVEGVFRQNYKEAARESREERKRKTLD